MPDIPSLQPSFSIITVCYNAGKTLERTIKSVIAQTYPHIEYLIIDGASKDNTIEIINRYKSRITRIVSEPDKGLYDAMNKAIPLAKGDYMVFLNAGDKLHCPETIEDMVETINGSVLPGVLYGDTDIVDGDGLFIRKRRLSPPSVLSWKSFRKGMLVCHQSFYARRDLVEKYNTRYRFSADFDWCVRVMKNADLKNCTLHNTSLVLTDYLSEGMTTRNHKASLKERFCIMANYYGLVPSIIFHIGFVFRAIIKK